jgi:hypothetical protein
LEFFRIYRFRLGRMCAAGDSTPELFSSNLTVPEIRQT